MATNPCSCKMPIEPKTNADFASIFLTAHHEAGHAVLAFLSQYHLPYRVRILSFIEGHTDLILSREKLTKSGKSPARVGKDRSVAFENAMIHYAGRYAETRFAKQEKATTPVISADRTGWRQDEKQAKAALSQAKCFPFTGAFARCAARRRVNNFWPTICQLANALIHSSAFELLAADVEEALRNTRPPTPRS